jgi:hypothetical protein
MPSSKLPFAASGIFNAASSCFQRALIYNFLEFQVRYLLLTLVVTQIVCLSTGTKYASE